MSWYTAGEIVAWLIVAALLGGVLGWLLRGILKPVRRTARAGARPTPVVIADEAPDEAPIEAAGTTVAEIDTGASGTSAQPVTSSFAPPTAKDLVAEIATRSAGGLTPPHDDLVRIRGVGPKLAGLLTSMGITSYRQIARFTPQDVATVNEALDVFPGRIERDDWMSSARALHQEVYGVEP